MKIPYDIRSYPEWGMGDSFDLWFSEWQDKYLKILKKKSITGFGWNSPSQAEENIEFVRKLSGCNISHISIRSGKVKDFRPLETLPDLEMISIDAPYTSCPDFAAYPNLRILLLNYRAPAKSLFQCKNLEYLHIDKYPHKDLQPLAHMKHLQKLLILTNLEHQLQYHNYFLNIDLKV